MPTAQELRELEDEELETRLAEYRRELLNLRFQVATGQLDNVSRVNQVRKDVARVLTLLRDREIAEAEGHPIAPLPPAPPRPPKPPRASRRKVEEDELADEERPEADDVIDDDHEDEMEAGNDDEVVDEAVAQDADEAEEPAPARRRRRK